MPLGLSRDQVNRLDFEAALTRIRNDVQSDFIYAPHINAIYLLAGDELAASTTSKLLASEYQVLLPITMEVPKASGFSRPGSILNPHDRLLYQLYVDQVSTQAESVIDRASVFSNRLLEPDPSGYMFEPSNVGYAAYREKIQRESGSGAFSHVLQADVASFFQNLNQHNLINLLHSAGCEREIVESLESLLSFITQKNSRGIIQGVLPSDFLGNLYLCVVDGELDLNNISFARFVDDYCIFFDSEREAYRFQILMAQWLRKEGLDLNEAKTKIRPIEEFLQEETEIERMFDAAKAELGHGGVNRHSFYHSTISWDFDFDPDEDELDEEQQILRATYALFDEAASEITRDKIHKFCIPTFIALDDNYGIQEVLERYTSRPHLSQVYAKYIRKMIISGNINSAHVERLLNDPNMLFEYQYMWLYAALMSAANITTTTVDIAFRQLSNLSVSEALRAVCAVFIGKFGNAAQKRSLRNFYDQEPSSYVKAAILYSARSFPDRERDTCYRAWGGHSELNSLIVAAARKTP